MLDFNKMSDRQKGVYQNASAYLHRVKGASFHGLIQGVNDMGTPIQKDKGDLHILSEVAKKADLVLA